MEPAKVNIVNVIRLIASVEEQNEYDQNVPFVNIVHEMISQWFDDYFDTIDGTEWLHEYFTDKEIRILLEFNDYFDNRLKKLPDTYEILRNHFLWKEVIGKANWVLDMLDWRYVDAKYDE